MSGAEWMMGKVGTKQKRPAANLLPPEDVTPAQLDDVERLLDDVAGDGKKLAAGLKGAVAALDRLAECGFSPELLVLMATDKAPWPKNAKHKLSSEQVRCALLGLFAIREFLR